MIYQSVLFCNKFIKLKHKAQQILLWNFYKHFIIATSWQTSNTIFILYPSRVCKWFFLRIPSGIELWNIRLLHMKWSISQACEIFENLMIKCAGWWHLLYINPKLEAFVRYNVSPLLYLNSLSPKSWCRYFRGTFFIADMSKVFKQDIF